MFCRSLFVLFLLAIVLSVLLRITDSDNPVGIFKLFFETVCSVFYHKLTGIDVIYKIIKL